MTMTSDQAVEVLRAAGEPTRLRILALLEREELAVLELCRILGQSQPRVSRHLKLLADAGLVERFPDGAWVFYRLAGASPIRALADQALDLVSPSDATFTRDAERLDGGKRRAGRRGGRLFRRQRRALGRDPLALHLRSRRWRRPSSRRPARAPSSDWSTWVPEPGGC